MTSTWLVAFKSGLFSVGAGEGRDNNALNLVEKKIRMNQSQFHAISSATLKIREKKKVLRQSWFFIL